MNLIRSVTAAALILLAVLPATGCGGDNSDQFREDYNAAVNKLSKINTDIGSATGGGADQSNAAIAKEFNQIADTAKQTRSDLIGLEPPEGAEEEFDELLSSLEKGVGDLRAVARAAKSNSPQRYNRAVEALAESGREITAAEIALKKAVDG
jgi:hypothetical protein